MTTRIQTDDSFVVDVPIAKVDAEQRYAGGWAKMSLNPDGSVMVDHQGDKITPDELDGAARDYVLTSRAGGDMHVGVAKARMVESIVFTPEKVAKMGLPADTPIGWWLGFRVDDDQLWDQVKKGERPMFSIQGRALRKRDDS